MPLLEIDNLKKSYCHPDGQIVPVVDVAAFSLESKQQVALCGESGSGKTTFLNLIAGILQPDSGSVSLAGQEMVTNRPRQHWLRNYWLEAALRESQRDRLRAETIGYIFQTFNMLQGCTCLENVLLGMSFGPGADRRLAEALLERVGLGQRLHHLPSQLSTGQQQRVAVARALANRPRLVLADEPTGNLDAANAREALALIRETCCENDAALLMVSHDRAVLGEFEAVHDLSEINRVTEQEGRGA